MPIMIDGHNLIPKIPGLSLSQIDDEQRLLTMVQDYCRIRRKQAEVYFDNAPPGMTKPQRIGTLLVKFARAGRTADQEIKQRLQQLGRSARNWIVISSDGSVQLAARAAQAQAMPAETFARELLDVLQQSEQVKPGSDREVPQDEVEWWLKVFDEGKKKKRE